jgi:hypothetical protein
MPGRTESPSAQLGQLLLRGWTMLAEACEDCQVGVLGLQWREQQAHATACINAIIYPGFTTSTKPAYESRLHIDSTTTVYCTVPALISLLQRQCCSLCNHSTATSHQYPNVVVLQLLSAESTLFHASAVQLPLMRDPSTMLGHCVGCRKMYDAEGQVVQVCTACNPSAMLP